MKVVDVDNNRCKWSWPYMVGLKSFLRYWTIFGPSYGHLSLMFDFREMESADKELNLHTVKR